ncbi:heparan sulfate glucosamine 3-O-sulfotransferase 1-like [Platysternon megacephalum]|uniref:Heparan sulfate glucosamine 3-O-sulfotransferase 1-like n=1 Tax=Platysternon megacephalum TaxID=55544 RepID=A0A4D9DU32_9SAUR|nr:heparan sulfate glucosamine 3-O-sulfotransferase 1-like [Platysternon megacephalum]
MRTLCSLPLLPAPHRPETGRQRRGKPRGQACRDGWGLSQRLHRVQQACLGSPTGPIWEVLCQPPQEPVFRPPVTLIETDEAAERKETDIGSFLQQQCKEPGLAFLSLTLCGPEPCSQAGGRHRGSASDQIKSWSSPSCATGKTHLLLLGEGSQPLCSLRSGPPPSSQSPGREGLYPLCAGPGDRESSSPRLRWPTLRISCFTSAWFWWSQLMLLCALGPMPAEGGQLCVRSWGTQALVPTHGTNSKGRRPRRSSEPAPENRPCPRPTACGKEDHGERLETSCRPFIGPQPFRLLQGRSCWFPNRLLFLHR